MLPDSVIKIAKAVHKACLLARKDEIIYQCYEDNLCGACGIAAFGVWEKLILSDYSVKFHYGKYKKNDHCWVSLDNYIIDPTYYQFDKSKPILIDKKNKNYNSLLTDRQAIDWLWLWKEESPKHFYFEWENYSCKLCYHESLLEEDRIL